MSIFSRTCILSDIRQNVVIGKYGKMQELVIVSVYYPHLLHIVISLFTYSPHRVINIEWVPNRLYRVQTFDIMR